MDERPGCLGGLFDFLQDNFGFGRGCSCTGIGCGFLLLILFILFACQILLGTDWTRLIPMPLGLG